MRKNASETCWIRSGCTCCKVFWIKLPWVVFCFTGMSKYSFFAIASVYLNNQCGELVSHYLFLFLFFTLKRFCWIAHLLEYVEFSRSKLFCNSVGFFFFFFFFRVLRPHGVGSRTLNINLAIFQSEITKQGHSRIESWCSAEFSYERITNILLNGRW